MVEYTTESLKLGLRKQSSSGSQPVNTGSNPVGATSNRNSLRDIEIQQLPDEKNLPGIFYLATRQRLRASFPDEVISFKHTPPLVYKISPT